jgi:hypothetical protein
MSEDEFVIKAERAVYSWAMFLQATMVVISRIRRVIGTSCYKFVWVQASLKKQRELRG